MRSQLTTSTNSTVRSRTLSRINEDRFSWIFVLFSVWYVGGLFLDGWAHSHGRVDASFFTIWHAVFYSGFMVTAGALLYAVWRNRPHTQTWLDAVPVGFRLSLLGSAIFLASGFGDMIWHTLYGIEDGTEALVSPTHIGLAVGMGLTVAGPLRSAWHRRKNPDRLPGYAAISAAFSLASLSFITMYLHPLDNLYPAIPYFRGDLREYNQGLGLGAILFFTITLCGTLLLLMRRWEKLPLGIFTFTIGINTALMVTLSDNYRFIPPMLLAGMLMDLFYLLLKPSAKRDWQLRLFAFLLPITYFAFYYQTLWADGLWWTEHVWVGSIFMAGVTGFLSSYLVFSPPLPDIIAE